MSLITIEHATRLGSPAEAEALYRAMGEREVSVKGWRPRDRHALERLVAAIGVERNATVSFESGWLKPESWTALEALVAARAGFLNVVTDQAELSAWDDHSQVAALPDGTIQIETPDPLAALRRFRELAHPFVRRGFITRVNEAARARLPAFLHALEGEVSAQLDLDVGEAARLAAHFPGDPLEWQADEVIVAFPEGTVTKYVAVSPEDDRDKIRKQWLARLSKLLKR